MTLVPPVITPVAVDPISITFRANQDLQPFSYRSTMTFGELLNSMKNWMYNVLVPYLNTNFEDITGSWLDNITEIDTAINTALSAQADQINSALTTQQQQVADELATTLNQITTGESAALNDSAVYNALRVANSQALAFLDGRYSRSGDTFIINRVAGFKADGSADMTALINTALAALPVGNTNAVILPSAFGKTIVRIDGTLLIDIAKSGLYCPNGGVEFDASHSTAGASIQVRATAPITNNIGVSGPRIGPFKLTGPGSGVAGTIGINYHEPASANTGGQIRNLRVVDVSVAMFETCIQYGDNAYNVVHDNCVIKGFSKYGVWFPSTASNSGERLVFTNSVIQEGYGTASVAIQNDGSSIYYYHGSVDYVNGYFVQNTGTARTEFQSTHFERYITTGPNPWFVVSGGVLKIRGGLITATGTYASGTAPASLFSNTASPTYTDGLILIDGVTFGNSLQVSGEYLATGTGNIIVRNTNRQNQFQKAFRHTAKIANLFSGQSSSSFQDKWFLHADTGTRTAAQRTYTAINGNNGSVTIQSAVKKSNAFAVQFTKTGGALSAFIPTIAVPITRQQAVGVSVWLARTGTVNGAFTLKFMYATIVDDGVVGPAVGMSQNFVNQSITPQTDFAAANTFYEYTSDDYVQRAPAWATHIVIQAECYNLGANSTIVIADPVATEF